MKASIKYLLLLGLLLMTACGYHLRGTIALPVGLKTMYVMGFSGVMRSELQAILRASEGKFVPTADEAGIVIKVSKEDLRRRALSIGSTGKSSEIELSYYLRFQFYDNKNNPLLEEQTLELTREFFNDQTALLAKVNEELLITKEMYKQAARMIMTRAQIAVETQPK